MKKVELSGSCIEPFIPHGSQNFIFGVRKMANEADELFISFCTYVQVQLIEHQIESGTNCIFVRKKLIQKFANDFVIWIIFSPKPEKIITAKPLRDCNRILNILYGKIIIVFMLPKR